jgi:hypothetical protein
MAAASSLADAVVMLSLEDVAASAEVISDVRAAAAAPTSATVPKKSRRPILLLICNPIFLWFEKSAAVESRRPG